MNWWDTDEKIETGNWWDEDAVLDEKPPQEIIDLAYSEYRQSVSKGVSPDAPIQAWTREAFEKYNQYQNWIPLVKKERTHFQKLSESWKRGREGIEIDVAYADALFNNEPETQDEVYKRYKLYQAREQLDPIESTNLLTKAEYGGARVASGFERSAESAMPHVIGASTTALIAGQLGPQAALPEEILTVPGAAMAGYKFGSAQFWYRQGVGTMALSMRDEGIDSKSSRFIAGLAAIPYALIEQLQIEQLAPGLRKGANKVITKSFARVLGEAAKKYGTTLASETLEEVGQEAIQIVAEDLAAYFEGQGIQVSSEDLKVRGLRLLTTMKEAAISMSLLPIPGAALDIVTGAANFETQNKGLAELQKSLVDAGLTEEQANITLAKAFDRTIRDFVEIENPTQEGVSSSLRSNIADVSEGFFAQKLLEEESKISGIETAEGGIGLQEDYGKRPSSTEGINKQGQLELNQQQKEINNTTVAQTITKLKNLVVEAPAKIEETKKLRSKELGKRFEEAKELLTSGKELEWLYRAKKALKGELPVADFAPVRPEFSDGELENLVWSIRTNEKMSFTERLNAEDALMGRLLNREGVRLVRPFELKLFEKAFGKDFVTAIEKKPGLVNIDYVDRMLQVLNVPRTLLASCDISHPLRQGLLLGFRHPILWARHTGLAYKAFFGKDSAKLADAIDSKIKTSRWYGQMKRAGLEIVPYETKTATALERSDEFAGAHYAENFGWGIGAVVRRSERAFVAPANYLRASVFSSYADMWEKSNYRASKKDYADLALFINLATLRAPLKDYAKLAPILNAGLFSPRAAISRIRLPYEVAKSASPFSKQNWAVRKAIWGNVVAAGGGLLMTLGLASMIPGVHVEEDPRSSDFGKIRYENTRIDLTAGYGPIMRLVARMIKGEIKSTDTDELVDASRKEVLLGYLRSQLNPAAGIAIDAATNSTFIGEEWIDEPVDILVRLKENFIPFAIQDIADAIYYQGLGTGLVVSPLAIMGAGVSTYPASPTKKTKMLKDQLSRETFGQKWDDIGPTAQKILRGINPQLGIEEARARYEQTNPRFLSKVAEEQIKSSKRLTKTLPKDVRKEFESLKIKLPGLGRRVGDGWFLNKKRYDEYHLLTSLYLNKVLPKVVRSPEWKQANETIKRELVSAITNRVKDMVRTQIITKATAEDLYNLKEYSNEAD